MKIVGLIPARMGSKRLPGKNMALLNGKPLLWYAIKEAQRSDVFERIIVSTDWDECLLLAENMGVNAFLRPDDLCTDSAHDYQWVKHALEWTASMDLFVILRPTSPFRTAETIQRAVFEFVNAPSFVHSSRAVHRTTAHPLKSWKLWAGGMVPYKAKYIDGFPTYDLSTQALGEVYVQNGCIQVAKTNIVSETRTVSGQVIMPFFTQGHEGLDINGPEDLKYAEWLMGRQ